jgi:prephenate dehydratase
VRVGYLGPEGTFTQEAAVAAGGDSQLTLVPLATVFDVVMAVHEGDTERGVVPIENSLEGSVSATLDALAIETSDVVIVAESVLPIRQCLIARDSLQLEEVEVVVSHPQANGQCSRFIRTRLPGARVMTASSTADAVRMVAEHGGRWAALGTRLAARLYGCQVLRAGVEDLTGNETRFVWLARAGSDSARGGRSPARAGSDAAGEGSAATPPAPIPGLPGGGAPSGPWKTAIVFWGVGSDAPGWLVGCLSEFASRSVNLTRIESRPRKQGLGRYMFFADLEGRDQDPPVATALAGLRERVESLRVLGSFPAAI